jgi:hypothetical protein
MGRLKKAPDHSTRAGQGQQRDQLPAPIPLIPPAFVNSGAQARNNTCNLPL